MMATKPSVSRLPSIINFFFSPEMQRNITITEMERTLLLLITLFGLTAFAQGQPDQWIRIDCGANTSTLTNGLVWQTDGAFINTGTNHPIRGTPSGSLPILNTVRAFTTQNKNCYNLSAVPITRYFIRAVFYYGNYDGLSNAPTFDLQIDGNPWATFTSHTDVVYYEILYPSQRRNISVCLTRTHADQFPFINSLELWSIPDTMYSNMNQELAWQSTHRYNFGTDDWIIGYSGSGDAYNRIWEPMAQPGTVNTTADPGTSFYSTYSEYPPDSALIDAIQSVDANTTLFLNFNFTKDAPTLYIEAYFTEMSYSLTETRSFDMYADGKLLTNVIPEYQSLTSIPASGQISSNNLAVELRPDSNTDLPPIISAIEVYAANEPLVTTGTNRDDLNGLHTFINTFEQLEGWSGEPCLPADTVWQWLGCTGTDPPRVTSLHLSGYDLSGTLQNFSQMQALVNIDLSDNSLTGQIPEFLGQLPNLRTLNLSNNHFSGTLPASIRNKQRLEYNIDGNPNVVDPGKHNKSTAMIIGLAVGLPLVFILLILALVYWLIRKRQNQAQGQETGTESGNGAQPDKLNVELEQVISPPAPSAPMEVEDDCVPVTSVIAKPNHQSMIPEMNLEEFEQLIDQYTETHATGHQAGVTSDDDCIPVSEHVWNEADDEDMVPDMDLEELDEIVQHENQRISKT